jgi:uncharacterized protein (TIGR02646 family)
MIRRARPVAATGTVYTDAGAERAQAIAHYGNATTAKRTFPFKAYGKQPVRDALNAAFDFKCAYCETYFGAAQPVAVEHYRPKSGYLVAGKMQKPGYYWLAAAWDNLLPSCTDCNSGRTQTLADGTRMVIGKANQFPITSEHKRATVIDTEKVEGRLLLHPYYDQPSKHLVFTDDGIVTWQRPGRKASKKAKESIRVYALLRDGLVRARAALEKDLKVQMAITENIVLGLAENPTSVPLGRALDAQLALLESFTEPEKPYSEMARQLLEPFLRKFADQ